MRRIALVAAGWALLPGCAEPFNERIDLAGVGPLPALAAPDPAPLGGTASLRGSDRGHWPAVTVGIPLGQTAHRPTYVSNVRLGNGGSPWNGRFPTAVEAIDGGAYPGLDPCGGLAEPVWAAVLLLSAPVDIVIHPPWSTRRSPAEPYDRLPSQESLAATPDP